MPSSSLIALFALVLGASNALPWAGPEETGAYRVEEFSPRPTSAPSFELLKRDSVAVNVCGWIGGRSDSVARCGSGSFCVHDTIHGFIGCCATAGPCTDGVYTTCIHSGMDGWQSQGGLINNGVLSCQPSSTCYQNTFPGNFKQFNCGESNTGSNVQTTYDGQPQDMRLQVVYTGVNFSPMSRPPIPTVPFNPDAIAPAGSGQSDSANDDETGYIAGGTVGGIAVAAILIAGIILLCRRRKRTGHRFGGVVGLHHRQRPSNPGGALKRLSKLYSPQEFGPLPRRTTAQDEEYMSPQRTRDDHYLEPISEVADTAYISPMTGHPDESQLTPQMQEQNLSADRDLLMLNSPMSVGTSEEGVATAVPISRLNIHRNKSTTSHYDNSPHLLHTDEEAREQQRQPLTGTHSDDFSTTPQQLQSRNWSQGYSNLNTQNEEAGTHIHSGHMQESQDLGLLGNMRRAASQIVSGNTRTQDKNVRSESMRLSNPFSDEHEMRDDSIWRSTPMSAPRLKEPDGLGLGLGLGENDTWGGLMSGTTTTISAGKDTPQRTQSQKQKANRPLMEQMMEAFNAATRGVGGNSSSGSSAGNSRGSEGERHRPGSMSISNASAASRYGGMYAVPEEEGGEDGEESGLTSGSGGERRARAHSVSREPVGGSVRGRNEF